MNTVTIVDYGIGNLLSVSRAFEHCGANVVMTDTASGIDAAEHLVLPGVGAFADGMEGLRQRGLVEPLRRYAGSGRPFLGICLGMQMLLEYSYEFGVHEGLGIIPGNVVSVPPVNATGHRHKIPHIGWNGLKLPPGRHSWAGTPLAGLAEGATTYFVHSFMAEPADPAHRLADCDYDGITLSAAISDRSITGCQFHPEKSGKAGLQVMNAFLRNQQPDLHTVHPLLRRETAGPPKVIR
jgi:glutamine amidotransferase